MLKNFKMDLHIHTCLSPCGEKNMSPQRIVETAKKKGLDVIGICDHNSGENVIAVRMAGKKRNLKVIGGIEVTSKEEVHLLVLFDEDKDLFEMQRILYENLKGENVVKIFGRQLIMSEKDEILDENNRLLISACELSCKDIIELAHRLSGLAIASHIDREGFGIIGQLGFIPPELGLDALEISSRISYQKAKETFPVGNYPLISSSDAHTLEDIEKSFTSFLIEDVSVEELKKALSGKEGRRIVEV